MLPIMGAFTGLSLVATSAFAVPLAPIPNMGPIRIEYFCSDGFAPRGGRCVATASRDEIEFFDVDPHAGPRVRHRHRRYGLRTLY